MDIDERIARATELAAVGDFRRAVESLKRIIDDDPLADRPRLALAQLYRDRNYPDQAGRWGIQTPGWTTQRERDAFARGLAGWWYGSPERRLGQLLRVPMSELSEEALGVVPPDHARGRRPLVEMFDGFRAGSRIILWMALAFLSFGVVLVYIAALFGAPDLRLMSRVVGLSALTLFVSAAALDLPAAAGEHRWVRFTFDVVVVIGGGVAFVFLAPIPGAIMPWESP